MTGLDADDYAMLVVAAAVHDTNASLRLAARCLVDAAHRLREVNNDAQVQWMIDNATDLVDYAHELDSAVSRTRHP